MTARNRIEVEVAAHGGLRFVLRRNEYGRWVACLLRRRKYHATHIAWGFQDSDAEEPSVVVDEPGNGPYLKIGSCQFELPEASIKKLNAWLDQVTNATPVGDNRGVPAGGSHAGPDAAAGKPDAAVEGALQPSPPDHAPPGLQQAAGSQALPVQLETPAVGATMQDAALEAKSVAAIQYHARECEDALRFASFAEQRIGAGMAVGLRKLAATHSTDALEWSRSLMRARSTT